MIEKLQKEVTHNLLITFEATGNRQYRKNFLDSTIRVLLNQGFPNASSSLKIVTMAFIRNVSTLEPAMISRIDSFIEEYSKQTDILQRKHLLDYEYCIIKEKKRTEGIIGGHRANLINLKKFFIKRLYGSNLMNEIFIYCMIPKVFPELKPFLVKCYGMILTKNSDLITDENVNQCVEEKTSTVTDLMFFPFEEFVLLQLLFRII